MLGLILFLVAGISIWKTAQHISSFIEEHWMLETQRESLRVRFEHWWLETAKMKPRQFAVALARASSETFNHFFGPRLFSKTAFTRSTGIATTLLFVSLACAQFIGRGLNPWREFDLAVESMRKAPELIARTGNSEFDQSNQRAAKYLKDLAITYGANAWKMAYCTTFFLLLGIGNAMSFFLSAAFSRVILREIVGAGRAFSAFALLALNLYISITMASLFLVVITILSYPALWFLVPLSFLLVQASVWWIFAIMLSAGILSWIFGNPFLQVLSLVAISPCVVTALICLISLLALANRKAFHRILCEVLLRCTGKRPVTFIVGFLGLAGIVIAVLCKLLQVLF